MIFCFVDLEFTQPTRKIIEIGAVAVDFKTNGTSEIISEFQTFCQPNESITEYIVNLTGISDETVKDAPQIKEALHSFWGWSKQIKTSQYVAWGRDIEMFRNASTALSIKPLNRRDLDFKSMVSWFLFLKNTSTRGG